MLFTIMLNIIWSTINLILFVILLGKHLNLQSERKGSHFWMAKEKDPSSSYVKAVSVKSMKRRKIANMGDDKKVDQQQLVSNSSNNVAGTMENYDRQKRSNDKVHEAPNTVPNTADIDALTPAEELTEINEGSSTSVEDEQRDEILETDDRGLTQKTSTTPSKKATYLIQPIQEHRLSAIWNIVGASVQGTSHIKANLPCQDYHDYRVIPGQTILASVADGLGSAERSDEGAKLAVETVLSSIAAALAQDLPNQEDEWIDVVKAGFNNARSVLEEQAQTDNRSLREYGTTLIVTILNDEWLVTGHIGDGAAVTMLEDKTLSTICPPQNGEYANQVVPLTAPNALELVEYQAYRVNVTALAIFSDGIQHLSIRQMDNQPHLPFFQVVFDPLPTLINQSSVSRQLVNYLASEKVCSKTDDDKTLVLIGRKNENQEITD